MDKIESTKDLDATTEKELDTAIQDFKKNGTY
jgi:F-type H+-transporting ATPase subunit alpha